ncbi:MAG: glycosyltransferase family 2 protein [Anaerolineae bacterium]
MNVMTELPLVTIVTPSFNQGRFIRETIESVLSQDYPRLEYIVVDGGSTDDTLDILRSYGERIAWVSEPDRGQSHAINKGFRRASGEILAWLNSDDTYLPGAVSASVAFLQQHPEIDLVYGDVQPIDENGHVLRERACGKPFSLHTLLTDFWMIPQPTAFFRRELLDKVGLLNENLHYFLDPDLWIRIALHGKGQYLPGLRAKGRLHKDSKTVAQQLGFWEERKLVLDELYRRSDLPEEALAAKQEAYAHCELYWGENLLRIGKRKEAQQHLRYALHTHPRPGKRLVALLLLVDSLFGTHFTSAGRKVRDAIASPRAIRGTLR